MKIETIVEFFWGRKTTYTKVELYPDGRIIFPDYDIERDAMLVDLLGEEPTQQYELYDAYEKYGIFGFDLVGKNNYFWASDYYKVLQNKKAKREWARFICETLGDYLNLEETFVDYQIEFIAIVIRTFADSFAVRQTKCWPELEIGHAGYNMSLLSSCDLDVLINGKKCMNFLASCHGSYGNSYPKEREWTFVFDARLGDNLFQNMDAIIKELEGDSDYITSVPEPYTYTDEPSPFKMAKNPKYIVTMCQKGELVFQNGYKTLKMANKAIEYIHKWFFTQDYNTNIFEKIDPSVGDFEYSIDDYGWVSVESPGWKRLTNILGDWL
jgi:hypothetical protein